MSASVGPGTPVLGWPLDSTWRCLYWMLLISHGLPTCYTHYIDGSQQPVYMPAGFMPATYNAGGKTTRRLLFSQLMPCLNHYVLDFHGNSFRQAAAERCGTCSKGTATHGCMLVPWQPVDYMAALVPGPDPAQHMQLIQEGRLASAPALHDSLRRLLRSNTVLLAEGLCKGLWPCCEILLL